jgi:hypothetical protein
MVDDPTSSADADVDAPTPKKVEKSVDMKDLEWDVQQVPERGDGVYTAPFTASTETGLTVTLSFIVSENEGELVVPVEDEEENAPNTTAVLTPWMMKSRLQIDGWSYESEGM